MAIAKKKRVSRITIGMHPHCKLVSKYQVIMIPEIILITHDQLTRDSKHQVKNVSMLPTTLPSLGEEQHKVANRGLIKEFLSRCVVVFL